jgi:hypothetical protein
MKKGITLTVNVIAVSRRPSGEAEVWSLGMVCHLRSNIPMDGNVVLRGMEIWGEYNARILSSPVGLG